MSCPFPFVMLLLAVAIVLIHSLHSCVSSPTTTWDSVSSTKRFPTPFSLYLRLSLSLTYQNSHVSIHCSPLYFAFSPSCVDLQWSSSVLGPGRRKRHVPKMVECRDNVVICICDLLDQMYPSPALTSGRVVKHRARSSTE